MSGSSRKLGYLADIDGLRALAVLAVILFHLRVPGFSGGYVGVDIFFVISGFLISGLIRDRVAADSFSFAGFYASRVNRLLPAVLATVLATALASVIVLQPAMMASFAKSALAAVFSAANFIFYFESGYWDGSADLKPLLHLWSLGVEEQFYLFWPALVVLLCKAPDRIYRVGLLLIFIASLGACVAYTAVDSAASFYLLPFRVWQFALGALVVELWRHLHWHEFARQVVRSTGLALCGISVFAFSDTTAFPGWLALVPSMGAALVLASAHEISGSVWLANPLARWLGRVSYALYLAHWPPVALYRSYTLTELTPGAQWALAAITLLLGAALHYGVERRFYQRATHRNTGWQKGASRTLGAALVLGILLVLPMQMPDQFTRREVLLSATDIQAYKDRRFEWVRRQCRIDKLGVLERCPLPPDDSAILFIGNSHEPDAFNILTGALGLKNTKGSIRFGSTNGCQDFKADRGWASSASSDCQTRLAALRSHLEVVRFKAVVYSARRPYADNKDALVSMLQTVKLLQPDVPIITFEDYLSTREDCANLINHYGSDRACSRLENLEYLPGLIADETPFKTQVQALSDHTFNKLDLLCGASRPASCPTSTPEGDPVFVDQHHLTREFAAWIGRRLAETDPAWLTILAARRAPTRANKTYDTQ